MEEIKNDGNVVPSPLPTTPAPADTRPVAESVSGTQPVAAAVQSTPATTDSAAVPIQTPPTTAPREELGTSAPAKKPRAPRKPAEPKKVAFSRQDEKAKGNIEEDKSHTNAHKEPVEQIDTSSTARVGQQQRVDEQSRVGEQSPDEESDLVERRLQQAKTSGGAQYVVSQGLFSRNNSAREAYDRIRQRIEQRTGGWSKGRFK